MFDPDPAERQLSTSTPFDDMPVIGQPRPQAQTPGKRSTNTSDGQQKKLGAAKATRQYAPRTFNIYQDQIDYLTKVSLEQRLAGRDVSMNDMVREAIDLYITQKLSKK
ncbi:MAG: hypothetical protein ACT4NP_13240 [Pseudonocardiales bacterium]